MLNGKIVGLEIAEVVELEPDAHRVKLKFTAWTEEETSHWAPVASWMAGPETGFYCMPNQGDKVLVAFHQGNRHEPYVLGALWCEDQKPPVTGQNTNADRNGDGKNTMRYWKTPAGHMVILDDSENAEKIQIIDKTGDKKIEMVCGQNDDDHVINISNARGHLNIQVPEGKLTIKCKQMEIAVDETLSISAKQKITIDGDDELEIKAKQDFKLSGANVETEAQQYVKAKGNTGVEIKGTQTTIEATSALSLKSNALAELQGKPVKIN